MLNHSLAVRDPLARKPPPHPHSPAASSASDMYSRRQAARPPLAEHCTSHLDAKSCTVGCPNTVPQLLSAFPQCSCQNQPRPARDCVAIDHLGLGARVRIPAQGFARCCNLRRHHTSAPVTAVAVAPRSQRPFGETEHSSMSVPDTVRVGGQATFAGREGGRGNGDRPGVICVLHSRRATEG